MSSETRHRRRPWSKIALLSGTAGLATSLAACSFAIPSLVPDGQDVTGSISRPEAQTGLGQEDARRARSALALALDPQGSGASVDWNNPDTKVRGTITPVGQPFVREAEICRDFKAVVVRTGRAATRAGTACRVSADAWSIQYLGFRPQPS